MPCEIRILLKLFNRGYLNQIPPESIHAFRIRRMTVFLHHVVVLLHREVVLLPGIFELQPACHPRRARSSQEIGVEALPITYISRATTPVPQMQGDRVVRMPWVRENSRVHLASSHPQLHVLPMVQL